MKRRIQKIIIMAVALLFVSGGVTFAHDLKGSGSDVSAMISGQRIFPIETGQPDNSPAVQTVGLDELLKDVSSRRR